MSVAQTVRMKVNGFPENVLFSSVDFRLGEENQGAVVKTLNRMVVKGVIKKFKKGCFYKPRLTRFGQRPLQMEEVTKDLLKDERGIYTGYVTGVSAFAAMGLTTQISRVVEIGTSVPRRAMKRGIYDIRFVEQSNRITKENIAILRLLDAMRAIKTIPAASPTEACERLITLVNALSPEEQRKLVQYALAYRSAVRALCGAILENVRGESGLTEKLYASLNSMTSYKLGIDEAVLPTKRRWRIR